MFSCAHSLIVFNCFCQVKSLAVTVKRLGFIALKESVCFTYSCTLAKKCFTHLNIYILLYVTNEFVFVKITVENVIQTLISSKLRSAVAQNRKRICIKNVTSICAFNQTSPLLKNMLSDYFRLTKQNYKKIKSFVKFENCQVIREPDILNGNHKR